MFQVSGIGPMFGQEAHFTHYAKERHPYAIERYSREVDRLMMVLDKRLGETAWLAGDDYTIADMATLPYLRRQFIDKVGRFPNVERWGAAMLDRPAVAEGMQVGLVRAEPIEGRSEEHTSELQSLMRI